MLTIEYRAIETRRLFIVYASKKYEPLDTSKRMYMPDQPLKPGPLFGKDIPCLGTLTEVLLATIIL